MGVQCSQALMAGARVEQYITDLIINMVPGGCRPLGQAYRLEP